MGHIINAEITVEIDDLGGYTPEQYIDGLERNLNNALGDGMLTGATPEIEIEQYSMAVLPDPESLSDSIEAHYADAIDSGQIRLEDLPKLLAANGLKTISNFLDDLSDEMLAEDRASLQL